jgi:hypothetical protein
MFFKLYKNKFMLKNNSVIFNLNEFLTDIKLKKQYIKKLQNKITLLSNVKEKNYKILNSQIFDLKKNNEANYLVSYIIGITFSHTNTLLHITDSVGNSKFFCSGGSLNFSGKAKKSRFLVFREMYHILISKLQFLKGQPVAVLDIEKTKKKVFHTDCEKF